jgi:hypothetical protein
LLDLELAHEGVRPELDLACFRRGSCSEIDKPAPQLIVVHPLGHALIVLVGHEEREGEAV